MSEDDLIEISRKLRASVISIPPPDIPEWNVGRMLLRPDDVFRLVIEIWRARANKQQS